MKNVLPKFERPIKGINEPIVDVAAWDKAYDAFEEKQYRTALVETINYINPSALKGVTTSGDFEIIRNQGSAEIHIALKGEIFSVKAPFLKITPETNRIALLRRVTEINFNPLTLPQIVLKGDVLWFQYSCNLALCQPNKVYDVLRDTCVFADRYDDEFIENYAAAFFHEIKHKPLSADEQEKTWSQIHHILTEYKEYEDYFAQKRWVNVTWDLIMITLCKLANMPFVHGTLRTSLEDTIYDMTNGSVDFVSRIDKGKVFMAELCEKSKDAILKNLYHAESFMSLRWRSSVKIVQEEMKRNEKYAFGYEQKEDYFALSYYLEYLFVRLMYDFNVDENYKNAIYDVLEEVSGAEPHIAAPKLMKVYLNFLNGTVKTTAPKKEKKGFFSKLFG